VRDLFVPLIKSLEVFDSTAVVAPITTDNRQGVRRISEAAEGERNLCSLALLCGDVFSELLVLPQAIRHGVDPRDISSTYKKQPRVVAELTRSMIRSALEVLLPTDSDERTIR